MWSWNQDTFLEKQKGLELVIKQQLSTVSSTINKSWIGTTTYFQNRKWNSDF
jgi:hypothetical protein